MLAVLGGLADVERDLIRTRTAEGRSRAQKHGQRMGSPTAEIDGGAEDRGTAATGGGRDACRTRAQLRRGKEYDFTAQYLIQNRSDDARGYRMDLPARLTVRNLLNSYIAFVSNPKPEMIHGLAHIL